jgi:predicted small integral membrane protein
LDGVDVADCHLLRVHNAAAGWHEHLGVALAGRRASRGVLAFKTTRGDRLFIALLAAAYLHLIWLALIAAPLWGATILSLVVAASIFRWV